MFFLALRFGWINPYAMARRIPAKLLREWELYFELEPPDGVRQDYYSAQIAAMLYNINRDTKKDSKGKPLTEFILFKEDGLTDDERAKKQQQDVEHKMRVMQLIMKATAEAAAESVQPPPPVIEHHYPQPDSDTTTIVTTPVEQDALNAARAAMKDVH